MTTDLVTCNGYKSKIHSGGEGALEPRGETLKLFKSNSKEA